MTIRCFRLIVLAAVGLSAACIVACGKSESGYRISAIASTADAAMQGKLLADSVEPEVAANAVVSWLAEASYADREYVRTLCRSAVDGYERSGNPIAAGEFVAAIDSIAGGMPVERRVHLMAVAASPSEIVRRMKGDVDRASLVPAFENEYAYNPDALTEFRRALAKTKR